MSSSDILSIGIEENFVRKFWIRRSGLSCNTTGTVVMPRCFGCVQWLYSSNQFQFSNMNFMCYLARTLLLWDSICAHTQLKAFWTTPDKHLPQHHRNSPILQPSALPSTRNQSWLASVQQCKDNLNHMAWEIDHFSHMDSKALIARAIQHFIKHCEFVLFWVSGHMHIFYAFNFISKRCELVEMCGKETDCFSLGCQVPKVKNSSSSNCACVVHTQRLPRRVRIHHK